MRNRTAVLSVTGLLLSVPAWARETAPQIDCFDVKLSAKPVEQIPSSLPNCGENCIVSRWPWFVDLEADRVLTGHIASTHVQVLAVQHTYLVEHLGIWWLRHNSSGGFNALSVTDTALPRCPPNAKAAAPYLRPTSGQTLDDLYLSLKRQNGEGK